MFAGKSFHQCKITMTSSLIISYTPLHIANFLVQLSLFLFHLHHQRKMKIEITVRWRNRTLVSVFRSSAQPSTKHSGAAPCLAEIQLWVLWLCPYVVIFGLVPAWLLQCHDNEASKGSLSSIIPWHNGTCKKRSIFNHLLILSCLSHC